MREQFPLIVDQQRLTTDDLSRFSEMLVKIILRQIPTAHEVVIATGEELANEQYQKSLQLSAPAWALAVRDRLRAYRENDLLILHLPLADSESAAAVVKGIDPVILQRMSADWLDEQQRTIWKELLMLKQALTDAPTGLLNPANLYALLDQEQKPMTLLLVHLPPARATLRSKLQHSRRTGETLARLLSPAHGLHSLGHHLYAIASRGVGGELLKLADSLLAGLKREGLPKVHIGLADSADLKEQQDGRLLLDMAWTALQQASGRGPYGYCTYHLLAHPQLHPLAPPEDGLRRKIRQLQAGTGCFSVVCFADQSTPAAALHDLLELDQGAVCVTERQLFVFLPETGGQEAAAWARGVLEKAMQVSDGLQARAGVASYPYGDCKKRDVLAHSQRALLHAGFFMPGTATLFDATSCNISGDRHYSDGNYPKAVADYCLGLQLEPGEVNLHNSLGVALVRLGRLPLAIESFRRALAISPTSFLALYNYALAERNKNQPLAMQLLGQALASQELDEYGPEVKNDILFELGQLAIENGSPQEALNHLQRWQEENRQSRQLGRSWYHVARAQYGIGDNRAAMSALQRALRHDEFDARALSLLGKIYLVEGEGDEIALSLCRKSVEIDPANVHYRLVLAEALLALGRTGEVRSLLRPLSKKTALVDRVRQLVAHSYELDGNRRMAARWASRGARSTLTKTARKTSKGASRL